MTSTTEMKFCKECGTEKPKTDFYKTRGNCVQTLCKYHTNQLRMKQHRAKTPKKVLGFVKLPEETRTNILNDIQSSMKIRRIAIKYDINYSSLLKWRKEGQLAINRVERE